jgi:hypothetical protein
MHSNRLIVGHRPPVIVRLKANDLQLVVNRSLSRVTRALGFFTTPFKRAGVFGWRDMHIDVVVVGSVQQIATSTDHFVTVDLRVQELTANGTPVTIDRDRYLRAEICARRLQPPIVSMPCAHAKVRIAGRLVWDSDGKGFLELHPQLGTDVEVLETAGPCTNPLE